MGLLEIAAAHLLNGLFDTNRSRQLACSIAGRPTRESVAFGTGSRFGAAAYCRAPSLVNKAAELRKAAGSDSKSERWLERDGLAVQSDIDRGR